MSLCRLPFVRYPGFLDYSSGLTTVPAREAPPVVSAPPAKATYLFRDVGSYSVSGADARKGTFPVTSVRTVGNIYFDGAVSRVFFIVGRKIAD